MAPQFQKMLTPSYKITKAALNAMTAEYGLTFAKEGFTFVAVSPGVSTSPCHESGCSVLVKSLIFRAVSQYRPWRKRSRSAS